jgi:hypothetical protein
MPRKSKMAIDLEELRQALPEPFDMASKLEEFFQHPTAHRLIAGHRKSIRLLLGFLETCREPALARVAVLLLSRFPAADFYASLLTILQRSNQAMTEAFDTGLWLLQLPAAGIARDLVSLVAASDNPYPLLLLQRPVALEVRSELAGFMKQRRLPLSLYALYSYGYALQPEDAPLLQEIAGWEELPEMAANAGLYLLKLGSKAGLPGIRSGLSAANGELRALIYYRLAEFLPKQAIEQAGYDPVKPADTQQAAVDNLLDRVK